MLKFVETVKKTYLCESVSEDNGKTKLVGALAIGDISEDADALSKTYVRSKIEDRLRAINLNTNSIESVEDATEVSVLIELMLKYLPIAEKKARSNGILAELDALMSGETSDKD